MRRGTSAPTYLQRRMQGSELTRGDTNVKKAPRAPGSSCNVNVNCREPRMTQLACPSATEPGNTHVLRHPKPLRFQVLDNSSTLQVVMGNDSSNTVFQQLIEDGSVFERGRHHGDVPVRRAEKVDPSPPLTLEELTVIARQIYETFVSQSVKVLQQLLHSFFNLDSELGHCSSGLHADNHARYGSFSNVLQEVRAYTAPHHETVILGEGFQSHWLVIVGACPEEDTTLSTSIREPEQLMYEIPGISWRKWRNEHSDRSLIRRSKLRLITWGRTLLVDQPRRCARP